MAAVITAEGITADLATHITEAITHTTGDIMAEGIIRIEDTMVEAIIRGRTRASPSQRLDLG
jgi:hypothetical protein